MELQKVVGRYLEEGYLHVPHFFDSDRMRACLGEADRLYRSEAFQNQKNLRARFQIRPRQGDSVLDALDPVIDISSLYRELAHDPKLLSLLHELLGTHACLFKDKLIYRPTGAPGQSLHQDYISWPGFPETFTTVMVALEETTIENGCLEVFPGEHHRGYLSPRDGDYHDLPLAALQNPRGVRVELEPGDLLVFGAFLPHRSSDNLSAMPRRQLYLSYNAISDGGFQRTRHYREFHQWLRHRYSGYSTEDYHFI